MEMKMTPLRQLFFSFSLIYIYLICVHEFDGYDSDFCAHLLCTEKKNTIAITDHCRLSIVHSVYQDLLKNAKNFTVFNGDGAVYHCQNKAKCHHSIAPTFWHEHEEIVCILQKLTPPSLKMKCQAFFNWKN